MDHGGVSGPWFETRDSPAEQRIIVNRDLINLKPSFLQVYGDTRFTYKTAWSLFWALATFYPARSLWWDKVLQRRYNRTELVRADRMKVLRYFLGRTIDKQDFRTSVVSLMAGLHSLRSMEHPRYQETEGYYEIVLESLVVSGDLERNGPYYSLAHKAVATLEHFDEQEERHNDMVTQQVRIRRLTHVLIAVTILQAVITIWEELHVDPQPAALRGDISASAPQ